MPVHNYNYHEPSHTYRTHDSAMHAANDSQLGWSPQANLMLSCSADLSYGTSSPQVVAPCAGIITLLTTGTDHAVPTAIPLSKFLLSFIGGLSRSDLNGGDILSESNLDFTFHS